jgi:hypothetical protein
MQAEIAWDPEGLIVEATSFPNGAHDDQVDAASQALAELYLHGGQASVQVPRGQIPGTRGGGGVGVPSSMRGRWQ